jgi:hypothetical protein
MAWNLKYSAALKNVQQNEINRALQEHQRANASHSNCASAAAIPGTMYDRLQALFSSRRRAQAGMPTTVILGTKA